MKKFLSILSVFTILFSTNIFAQDQASTEKVYLPGKVKVYNAADFQVNPEKDAQDLTQHLNKQLSLNYQQETAIYQINFEAAQKKSALTSLQSTDSEAFVDALMAVYRARNTAIENVLTTKQKLEFSQMKESMMSRKTDAE